MVDGNSKDEGPSLQFRWDFPMIRIISVSGRKISSKLNSVRGDSIPKRIKDSTPQFRSSSGEDSGEEYSESNDSSNRLTDLQNDIKSLRDGSSTILGQSDSDADLSVEFTGSTFIPLRIEVEPNEELIIENTSDQDITVEQKSGPAEFTTDIASDGDDAIALSDEGVYIYGISGESEGDMCGAIIVGDVNGEIDLPCEDEVDRELFDDNPDNSYSSPKTSSLSEAAEDKEREF